MSQPEMPVEKKSGAPKEKRTWCSYIPLIVLVGLSLVVALVKQYHYGAWELRSWMHDFMGFSLVVFAMLKLFDLPGFARGFQKYDLLAKHSTAYAKAYPFIELALGLGYLSFWQAETVYIGTALVMGVGALGVLSALQKKMDLNCACMGATLNVPLTTVALTEDLVMAGMALSMLLM